MALLERVATLLRANLNDLIERAEDPVRMMKQVVLDMENQLLQLKTQVAIAVADQHLLERKRDENAARQQDWVRKAEMALERLDDELARSALERSLASRDMARNFGEQMGDQKVQVENLRSAMKKLEAKLAETRVQADLLTVKHRQTRRAGQSPPTASNGGLTKAQDRIERGAAFAKAQADLTSELALEERFADLEKREEVDRLLAELKARKS